MLFPISAGFLQLLSLLTKVGDVTKEMFLSMYNFANFILFIFPHYYKHVHFVNIRLWELPHCME